MKLFSKRNKTRSSRDPFIYGQRSRENELLNNELRNRLAAVIKFLTSIDDFLEFFILFENQKKETIFLDGNRVDGFSLKEMGYKMTDYFEFENFAIKEFEYSRQIPTRTEDGKMERVDRIVSYFDDYKLFDLIEFIILFSKKEKREEVIKRFNEILIEEDFSYEIISGMITKKSGDDIYTIQNLLNDDNLKSKIDDYRYFEEKKDFLNASKVSAEIINIIFSDEIEENKKTVIIERLNKIADVLTKKEQDKSNLFNYLNEELLSIKNFNNNIYNIRHTEKSTIHLVDNSEAFYKAVAQKNISFVEMTMVSLKDDFIYSEDWEDVKNNYISKYQINKGERLIIKKPEIDISNIPF